MKRVIPKTVNEEFGKLSRLKTLWLHCWYQQLFQSNSNDAPQ